MRSNWMAQLAPDHPPPSAGRWPPAPGWWVVLTLTLLLLAFVILWSHRRDPFRASRRAALREIRCIEKSSADEIMAAQALQSLMRRYAIAIFGLRRVARLTGESWLRFVGEQGGSVLAGPAGRSLLAAAFANQQCGERESWLSGARQFVQQAARGDRTR
jgi:Domain of unknown function (DUF4381)